MLYPIENQCCQISLKSPLAVVCLRAPDNEDEESNAPRKTVAEKFSTSDTPFRCDIPYRLLCVICPCCRDIRMVWLHLRVASVAFRSRHTNTTKTNRNHKQYPLLKVLHWRIHFSGYGDCALSTRIVVGSWQSSLCYRY